MSHFFIALKTLSFVTSTELYLNICNFKTLSIIGESIGWLLLYDKHHEGMKCTIQVQP